MSDDRTDRSSRVLVIEDDRVLGAQIKGQLERNGFEVTYWAEGRFPTDDDLRGLDLLVLDLMLPGAYGLDILKDLRAKSDVPVLVLSARIDTSDKVRALALGADDYMTKPFWPEELVARVKARLRRPTMQRSSMIEVGALRIDRDRHEVYVDGARVDLTRVEFALISALAERPGKSATRAALVEQALDTERDGAERALDVHISRLRKKLGPGTHIETVWGIGYRLATGPGKQAG